MFGPGYTTNMLHYVNQFLQRKMNIQAEKEHPSEKILKKYFSDCADFMERKVKLGEGGQVSGTLLWVEGLVGSIDLADTVLRPLTLNRELAKARSAKECAEKKDCRRFT